VVDEIMTADVVVCRSDETLGTVSRRMDRTGVPCAPVLQPGSRRRVVAMLTDRDIGAAAAQSARPLDSLSVDLAMSPVLRSCWPDDSPEAATAIMRAFGVRRLPVVDAAFDLVGLVALGDLARTFLAKDALPGDAPPCDGIAETLAAVIRVAGAHTPGGHGRGDIPPRVAL
jgi:CBS domain-containing protein